MSKVIEQIVRLTTDGDETRAEVIGELTRCKNCKLFGKMCETDPEAYCSMAQRKDGEQDDGKRDN